MISQIETEKFQLDVVMFVPFVLLFVCPLLYRIYIIPQ